MPAHPKLFLVQSQLFEPMTKPTFAICKKYGIVILQDVHAFRPIAQLQNHTSFMPGLTRFLPLDGLESHARLSNLL